MHLTRRPRAFALAAIAASITVGVTQATAQGAALVGSGSAATAAASRAPIKPTSLKWIRDAIAEANQHHASAKLRPAITIGHFKDCPKLPASYDRSQFLCLLIHITGGELVMGNTNQILNREITVPFAEGTDPSSNLVLVPGTLKSSPMPVLGGIFLAPVANAITNRDPNLKLSVKPIGVGIAIDPTGNTAAIISQKIQAINPIFGKRCFVGSNTTPIVIDPTFGTTNPPAPNQPISGSINSIDTVGNELVIIGTVVDNAFAAPPAHGCGPDAALTQVVNEVSALPAAAGTNTAIFQVTVEAINYTSI
jgi:hypothetical protein